MNPDLEVSKQKQEAGLRRGFERRALGPGEVEVRRVACHITESLLKRILRKLFPDQRQDERRVQPPLVGYLGTMNASRPFEVADISLSGFCLLTDERWEPGTEMPITLERTALPDGAGSESFTVQATVVRCGDDGVGFSIVLSEDESSAAYGNPLRVRWVSRSELAGFLRSMRDPSAEEQDSLLTPKPERRPGTSLKAALESGR